MKRLGRLCWVMVEADAFTDFIVVVKRSMCSVMEGIVVVKYEYEAVPVAFGRASVISCST